MSVIKLDENQKPSGMVCPRFKLREGDGGGVCIHRTATGGCGLLGGEVPCSPAVNLEAPTEAQRQLLTGLQALARERPDGIECASYERASATSKRCAHYVGDGACGLASEFMCVEWSKLNDPELYERQRASAADHLLRLSSAAHTAPTAAPDPFAAPGERPATTTPHKVAERYSGPPTCAEVLDGIKCGSPVSWCPSGEVCEQGHGGAAYDGVMPPRPSPRLGEHLGALKAKVPEELMSAPAAFDPALLTDDALASLEASGIECCVSSADLGELWLVPAHTQHDRPELTYRHARTILITMSIMPGATLTALRRTNTNKDPR